MPIAGKPLEELQAADLPPVVQDWLKKIANANAERDLRAGLADLTSDPTQLVERFNGAATARDAVHPHMPKQLTTWLQQSYPDADETDLVSTIKRMIESLHAEVLISDGVPASLATIKDFMKNNRLPGIGAV